MDSSEGKETMSIFIDGVEYEEDEEVSPKEVSRGIELREPAPSAPKSMALPEGYELGEEIPEDLVRNIDNIQVADTSLQAPVAPPAPEEPKSWFDMISPYGAETAAKENPEWWQTGIAAFKDLGSAPGRNVAGMTYGITDLAAEAIQNPMNALKNIPEIYMGGYKDGASIESPDNTSLVEGIVKDPYGGAAMLAAPLVAPIAAAQPAVSYLSKLPYAIGKIGMGLFGGAGAGAATQLSENLYDGLDADRDIWKAAAIGGAAGGLLTGGAAGLDWLRKSGLDTYVQDILANTKASIANKSKQKVEDIVEDAVKKEKWYGFGAGIKDAIAEKFSDKAKLSKAELDAIYADLDQKFADVVEPNVHVGDFESGVFNPNTKRFESRSPNDDIANIGNYSVAPLVEARNAEYYLNDRLFNASVPGKVINEEIAPRLSRVNNITGKIDDATYYPPGSRRSEGDPGSGYVSPSEAREIQNSLYQYAEDYVGPNKAEVQKYVDKVNGLMSKRLDDIYNGTRPIRAEDLPAVREDINWAADPALMGATDEQLLTMTPKQVNEQILKGLPEGDVRRNIVKRMIDRGESGAGLTENLRKVMDEAASSKALVEGASKSKYFSDNKKLADTKVRDIGSLQLLTDAVNQVTKPGRFTGPGAKIAVGGAGRTRSLPIPLATLMASQLTEQDYKAVERILLKPEKDRTEKEINFLKAKGQL